MVLGGCDVGEGEGKDQMTLGRTVAEIALKNLTRLLAWKIRKDGGDSLNHVKPGIEAVKTLGKPETSQDLGQSSQRIQNDHRKTSGQQAPVDTKEKKFSQWLG